MNELNKKLGDLLVFISEWLKIQVDWYLNQALNQSFIEWLLYSVLAMFIFIYVDKIASSLES